MLSSSHSVDDLDCIEQDDDLRKEAEAFLKCVPSYFPKKDRLRMAEQTARVFRCIDAGGDPYRDELQCSQEPDVIFQGHFAISEQEPLVLEGGGMPCCIGVMLMNEKTGRSMAVHLEARDEQQVNVHADAHKFIEKIFQLFNDQPTRIDLVSILGGVFPHHDAVRTAIVQRFGPSVLTAGYHIGTVTAYPRNRTILVKEI